MHLRSALSVLLTTFAAEAQRTWIVDAGYNNHFVTIQAAVNAASDGDVILLQYASGLGLSWNFTLNKGVTILGDDGSARAGVHGHLVIDGLQPHQRVVLRSLEPDVYMTPPMARVTVQNCAGMVVVDDCRLSSEEPFTGMSWGPGLHVVNSAHVAVHRSTLVGAPALLANGGQTTCTGSGIWGRSAPGGLSGGGAADAIQATGSGVWLAGCSVSGGSNINMGSSSGPSRVGLVLRGATATAAATTFNGGNVAHPAASVDLDAASSLTHDAATVFLTPAAGAIANLAAGETGHLAGGLLGKGVRTTFTLDAAAGAFAVLAIALPGPPVPTSCGTVWLDGSTTSVLAIGQVPVQAPMQPPSGAMRGFALTCQGVVLHQGALRASTPVVSSIW